MSLNLLEDRFISIKEFQPSPIPTIFIEQGGLTDFEVGFRIEEDFQMLYKFRRPRSK